MSKTEFKMPKMGESITEGTIINWLVNEGDSFEEGDILLEVATDKVDNEVPAPSSGKMLEHKFKPQDVVPVGEVIAVLELSENSSSEKPASKTSEKKETIKVSPSSSSSTSKSFKVNENVFISPLVDAIARKNHISYEELARIGGTGKDGRLRKSDVSEYLENGRPFQFAQAVPEVSGFQVPDLKFDKGKGKIVEMDRMRQMIADHMVFSKHTSPHVTAYVEADLT
jgi:2-oxoglutarate dehydrogenase E2 component (dihydrolipoamide succinyltransferase)